MDLLEGTVKKVKDGSELVTRTNEAFLKVSDGSLKVGELVGEIAAASNEQAQGITGVNQAVAEMDRASAEESASASEEMKGMVGDLVNMVGRNGKGRGVHAVRTTARRLTGGTPRKSPSRKVEAMKPEALLPMHDKETLEAF